MFFQKEFLTLIKLKKKKNVIFFFKKDQIPKIAEREGKESSNNQHEQIQQGESKREIQRKRKNIFTVGESSRRGNRSNILFPLFFPFSYFQARGTRRNVSASGHFLFALNIPYLFCFQRIRFEGHAEDERGFPALKFSVRDGGIADTCDFLIYF